MPFFIPLIIFAVCAMLSALMDVLQFHFELSIFKGFKEQFFNPIKSWKNKYIDKDQSKGLKKFPYLQGFSDAWHSGKSSMIILLAIPIATTYQIIAVKWLPSLLNISLNLSIYGCVWILVFNTFYNHLFIKKSNIMSNSFIEEVKDQAKAQNKFERQTKIGYIAFIAGAIIALGQTLFNELSGGVQLPTWVLYVGLAGIAIGGVVVLGVKAVTAVFSKKPSGQGKQ
jgi:hypothetical protein